MVTNVGHRYKVDDQRRDIILSEGDSRPGYSGGAYVSCDETFGGMQVIGSHLGTVTSQIEDKENISADRVTVQYGQLYSKVAKNIVGKKYDSRIKSLTDKISNTILLRI